MRYGKGNIRRQRKRRNNRQYQYKQKDKQKIKNKMEFKHAEFNTTEQIEEKGIISGRKNTIFLRNKYQTELDNANAAVVDMVHYCQRRSEELKESFNKAQGIRASIKPHEKERENAYTSLGNLLNREKGFEAFMHKETSGMYKNVFSNRPAKSIKIKQKINNSDNEMIFASMVKYIKKYPEYQTKSSFKRIYDKILEQEKEIREIEVASKKAVSAYHNCLTPFEINVQKANDKIKMYHQLLEEGQRKIDETRYKRGIFYKLTSERKRNEANLDIIKHRMSQFENTLKIIEDELSQYEGIKFKEMEY